MIEIIVGEQVVEVEVGGAQGPRGFASGPLGAGSVGAEEVTDDPDEQLAIPTKLRVQPVAGGAKRPIAARAADQLALPDFAGADAGGQIAAADAVGGAMLPAGAHQLAAGIEPLGRYAGEGEIIVGRQRRHLNRSSATMRAGRRSMVRLGDLAPISAAIARGKVRLTIVGDSIPDGQSQVAPEDAIGPMLARELDRAAGPVKVEVINRSLPGRGIGDLNADAYKATAGAPVAGASFKRVEEVRLRSPDYVSWKGGSVPDKSWWGHVADDTPDGIVIFIGQNDFGDPYGFWGALRNVIANRVPLLAKRPAVILVTTPLPTRRDPAYAAQQERMRAVAWVMRSLAGEFGCTLIDLQRWQEMHRDGLDRVDGRHASFSGTDVAGWTVQAGAMPTGSGGVLTFAAAGSIVRGQAAMDDGLALNGVLQLTATLPSGAAYAGWRFRIDPGTPARGYLLQLIGGGAPQVQLYYHDGAAQTLLGSAAVTPAGDNRYTLRLRLWGARPIVEVNEVLAAIDPPTDYRRLLPGLIGLVGGGNAQIVDLRYRLQYPDVVGRQEVSDADVFGDTDDSAGNAYALGGDLVHHPGIFGHRLMLGAFAEWIGWFGQAAHLPQGVQAPEPTLITDTTTVIAAGDFFDVTINGSAASGSALAGTDLDAGLAGEKTIQVTDTATPVPVRFRRNGADFLTAAVTVPAAGWWRFRGEGEVTSHGGLLRHQLLATALRVG